jgi:hypothetical protein
LLYDEIVGCQNNRARSIPLSKINGLHRLNYMEHSYEFELFSIFGHDTAKIKSRQRASDEKGMSCAAAKIQPYF